jgi:hypothetical protein
MYGNSPARFTNDCSSSLVSWDCFALAAASSITSRSVDKLLLMRAALAATSDGVLPLTGGTAVNASQTTTMSTL